MTKARPRLLDLFSGAGGAAMGYSRAGFDVYGVDNDPKPLRHYPFPYTCGDALNALGDLVNGEGLVFSGGHTLFLEDFGAIHASPPCQGYSVMNNLPWLAGKERPLLIKPTMDILASIGLPYIVENVMGARWGQRGLAKRGLENHGLQAGWLCGFTLGLPFPRHRLFAANFLWLSPPHVPHPVHTTQHGQASGWTGFKDRNGRSIVGPGNKGKGAGLRVWQDRNNVGVGHAAGWHEAAEAMGIDWMTRGELTQAIPPAYTEYIGAKLLAYLGVVT